MIHLRRLVPLLLTAFCVLTVATAAQAQAPPEEAVVVDEPTPPPILQGPGKPPPSPYPCGLDGPLLNGVYEDSHSPLPAAMIFVDFSDATGEGITPQELYDKYVPSANAAFLRLSGGTFTVQATPLLTWLQQRRPHRLHGGRHRNGRPAVRLLGLLGGVRGRASVCRTSQHGQLEGGRAEPRGRWRQARLDGGARDVGDGGQDVLGVPA